MLFRMRYAQILSTSMIAATLLSSVGCGDLVSGANLKPSVTYKPSSTGSPNGESAATSESASGETAAGEGTGDLKGKIAFGGAFTPLPPLHLKGADVKDAAVCAAEEAPDQSIIVKDGGLANVFVYLRKAPKVAGDKLPDTNAIFDQKNCVFKPHAMTVRVNQVVKILNSDAVAHNTHTNGVKTTSFNSIVNPNDTVGATLIYKQAELEPISVVCDIHSWMRAFHLPIDHPFAAVSAEDGTFEIKGLPVGKHEFKVWHEVGKLIEKSYVVTIKPGVNEITIPVSAAQLGK